MLRIYPVLLRLVADVQPLVRQLERSDPDLARQCKQALSSGPLNVAEGSYSRGRNRKARPGCGVSPQRQHTAVGSVREGLSCFEVAAAMGYMPEVDAALRARFDHVIGTLVNVIGGH